MKNLIIIGLVLSYNLVFAQLDSANTYCLNINNKVKLDKKVKTFTETIISDLDTSIRFVQMEDGLYKNEKWTGFSEWNYHYDDKQRVIKVDGFSYDKYDTTQSVITCNYDNKDRLISYIIEDKSKKDGKSIFVDTITYFNDSLKYQTKDYSFYSYWYYNNDNLKYRIKLDGSMNIKQRDKFIENKLISTEYLNGDVIEIRKAYLYNSFGEIKIVFDEQLEGYSFIEYEYDRKKRLVKEISTDNFNKISSIINYTYNKYGLIDKIKLENPSGYNQITLYDYSYCVKKSK